MDVIEKFLALITSMFSLATSIVLYRAEKLKNTQKRKKRNHHKGD